MGIHLFGTTAAGVVYSDTYAPVRENLLTQQTVTDPSSIAILNQASTYAADPSHFDLDELRRLYAQGTLAQLPASVPSCTDVAAGCTCEPGQTANGLALTCEPSADWVEDPGVIVNAFKGDFIIHHACGDMIADLLKTIGQEYSHSMTVSKNQVAIRHSTASENRMVGTVDQSIIGGVIGGTSVPIDENTLRFGFPGTAGTTAYSVDAMVNGYCVPRPSGDTNSDCATGSGLGWSVTGSLHPDPSVCTSDVNIVYPLVIRPPPDATPAQLQAIAPVGDQASQITGHYRFFMYSRADQESAATSGASWAVGTQESVCSLFDLLSTQSAGPSGGPLPLQGPIGSPRPVDPVLGVPIPDGMVSYSVDKRNAAAWEIFTNLYNMVQSKASGIPAADLLSGGGLDQLADSVGNQVVNCFAADGCGDSSNAWHNVQPGIAVSPDDIRTSWVTTANGGTYGYSEPAIYVPSFFRHQYTWVATTGAAQMTVNVVDGSGNPVANATVLLDTMPVGSTDSSGSLVVPAVAQGNHDLQAQEYVADAGTQQVTTPVPMSVSAMMALPSCSSTTATGISSPCQVTASGSLVPVPAPSCPDLWSQECLALDVMSYGSPPPPGTSPSMICACFAPPPPLSCDAEFTADHLVTVPSSGNVTYLLTLCDTCNDAGAPNTTCAQHCATDADCVGTEVCKQGICSAVPTIDVAVAETQEGPFVCVQGSGFTPATSYATLTYSNVPGAPSTVTSFTQLQVLPDGTVAEYQDSRWVGDVLSQPGGCPFGQQVIITVQDQLTGEVASSTKPVEYWCQATGIAVGTLSGDFCCGGLCP